MGCRILDDFRWREAPRRWALHCRLTADIAAGGAVPQCSDWYLVVEDTYPAGSIGLFPARSGGITATFPHQSFNREGSKDLPWREGRLCLYTDVRALGGYGLDTEARDAAERLAWHVRRAQLWLLLAAAERLLVAGDPFELPDYPTGLAKPLLVFDESSAGLERWLGGSETAGLVELAALSGSKRLLLVRRLLARDGTEILAPAWGRYLQAQATKKQLGSWIRVERPVVLSPWQAPITWGELAGQLASQGVALGAVLDRLAPPLRRHELPRAARPAQLVLIGFPIPEEVGGRPRRLHWLGIEIPALSAGEDCAKGFRKDEKGYRMRDTILRPSGLPLRWLPSECWSQEERSSRGRLAPGLRGARVALLGAGALGSAVAELLVRGGVNALEVFDSDTIEAGNLVRHTLGLPELGENKADALARHLNDISPSAMVEGVAEAFQERPDSLTADLVIDATAEEDTLLHLARRSWRPRQWLASIWLGWRARRGFCFAVRGEGFAVERFHALLEPWLAAAVDERGNDEWPRAGVGCWHWVFPARADDVWLMASVLVKHLETLLGQDSPGEASLAVYEQRSVAIPGPIVSRLA